MELGTPIYLSRHNQDILYMGSINSIDLLIKEMSLKLVKDLTNGGVKGNVSYGTSNYYIESDLKFG